MYWITGIHCKKTTGPVQMERREFVLELLAMDCRMSPTTVFWDQRKIKRSKREVKEVKEVEIIFNERATDTHDHLRSVISYPL